jgi:hypothetical protein
LQKLTTSNLRVLARKAGITLDVATGRSVLNAIKSQPAQAPPTQSSSKDSAQPAAAQPEPAADEAPVLPDDEPTLTPVRTASLCAAVCESLILVVAAVVPSA